MREIKHLTVLGAGVMGKGIAQVGAAGGLVVDLVDVNDAVLDKAIKTIEKNLNKGVQLGKVAKEAMEAALKNLNPQTDLEQALAKTDFVIEVVPEELELKHKFFSKMDEICAADVILATNTSAKSITEIAAVCNHPERVIGMHFFNPAHIMKLVEIVRGLETHDEAVKATEYVSELMGKETVEVNEFPGFATSRINAMIGNEAFYMLMEGVASPKDIDKSLKLGLNHPMGPFELGDLVGWDTRLKVLQYLHESLGDKFRPCPLLVKYVKAGRLGRKVGKGIYMYDEDGRIID